MDSNHFEKPGASPETPVATRRDIGDTALDDYILPDLDGYSLKEVLTMKINPKVLETLVTLGAADPNAAGWNSAEKSELF